MNTPLPIFYEDVVIWGGTWPRSRHLAQYDKIVSDALRDIAYGADPKTRLDAAVRSLQPVLSRCLVRSPASRVADTLPVRDSG